VSRLGTTSTTATTPAGSTRTVGNRGSPSVTFVLPEAAHDPDRPSGGNGYDRRLVAEFLALGWQVGEVSVGFPVVPAQVAAVLDELPDGTVVVVDGLIAGWSPEVLRAAARRLRMVPLLHMASATEDGGPDPWFGAFLASSAAVVTTSRWTAGRLAEWYPGLRGSVAVAIPGADRADAAEPGDGSALLCVAAVAPHKGLHVLVAALAELIDLPWQCTMVGPLDRDPGYVAEIRMSIGTAGLAERCELVGTRTGDELEKTLASADVLVHPTLAESYGMVVTEALAHGIPVIGSDVGGMSEALGHLPDGGRPGILVPPDDPAALANALRDWLIDPALRGRLTRAALDRRQSLPTWAATAEIVADTLRRVAG
jgi:hypothetical protein